MYIDFASFCHNGLLYYFGYCQLRNSVFCVQILTIFSASIFLFHEKVVCFFFTFSVLKVPPFEYGYISIIPLDEHIKSYKAPNTLYYDSIHFNFQLGLPLIKNCIMKYVTWHSSNIPRVSNEYRPNTDRAKRNYWYQRNPSNAYFHNPMATYHYMGDAS